MTKSTDIVTPDQTDTQSEDIIRRMLIDYQKLTPKGQAFVRAEMRRTLAWDPYSHH